jgi:mannosylglucosylglycerate synthase
MKIALLHYSSPPVVGGVESVLAQHALLMTRAGHQVRVLTGRGESFDGRIPVEVLPRLNSRHPQVLKVKGSLDRGEIPPDFEKLSGLIQEDLLPMLKEVDILFAHNVASLHKNLPLTAALQRAAQAPAFPRLILWHHDLAWTNPRYQRELHAGYPWDLLCSDWVSAAHVTVSRLRQRELAGLFKIPLASIRVIPNGVNLNLFYKLEAQTVRIVEQLGLAAADPLLLLPVRLTPRKNIELALHVLAELRKTYPHIALLVTGPEGPHNPANAAYKQKLLHLRDELKLQGAAHFLAEQDDGFLPDAVVADFYRLADALFLPSREEGFGIPILEAAVSSLPIFCTDLPVLCELGQADVTYFDPDSEPALIARQVSSRLEAEAISRWARRAKHGYSWDSIYAAHIAPLIQEAVR